MPRRSHMAVAILDGGELVQRRSGESCAGAGLRENVSHEGGCRDPGLPCRHAEDHILRAKKKLRELLPPEGTEVPR